VKTWHGGYKWYTQKAKEQGKEEAAKRERKFCTQRQAGRYK
jgi:hypothetical protein